MRLYGGRKINRSIDRRFRTHTESRDAIVWDVDQTNGIARCKVQGSDELIQCHYPQNWQTLPYYVKPGFAIRIIHKGGQKGFQEISGPGRAIPSPVAGPVMPPPPPLFDGVMSGMTPSAPGGGMYINLTNGSFRIDGITYQFDIGDGGVTMGGDGNIMDSVTGMPMGAGTNATLLFDTAPVIPNARYDLVVVAIDGIADIVKGTASANPVMPDVPADHIKICHVLILGGRTELVSADINAEWEPREFHYMTFALSGTYAQNATQMKCSLTDANPYVNIVITFKCQYNWAFSMAYDVTLTKDLATGTLGISTGGPWVETPVNKTGTGSTVTFYYRRAEVLFDPDPPGGPLSIDNTGEGALYEGGIAKAMLRATMAGYLGINSPIYIDLLFTT